MDLGEDSSQVIIVHLPYLQCTSVSSRKLICLLYYIRLERHQKVKKLERTRGGKERTPLRLKHTPSETVRIGVCYFLCTCNLARFDGVNSGGQGRSKYGQKLPHIAPYCSVFWPSLTPTVNPVKSLLFKMVCTCVPHIVLHVLSSTSTSGGYFRPQKSILTKIAIFGCFGPEVYPPLGCHLGNIKTYTG